MRWASRVRGGFAKSVGPSEVDCHPAQLVALGHKELGRLGHARQEWQMPVQYGIHEGCAVSRVLASACRVGNLYPRQSRCHLLRVYIMYACDRCAQL